MKPSDLRAMTVDQLDDEFLKLKKERFNLRFQRATGQLENTARVRQVRRDNRAHQDDRDTKALGASPVPLRHRRRRKNRPSRSALRARKPRRSNQRCRSAHSRAS